MIIIILILLFTSPLYATDYYFSLAGDNSDGLTPETAYTSYTSISSINFAGGGQTLYFRAGDDFTIDADNESKNILLTVNPVVGVNTFQSYGTGTAPILPRTRIRNVKNYTFDGLHFKYTGVNPITSPIEIYNGSYNITLTNCTVTSGGYSNAVAIFNSTTHDITVSGCTIINGDDAGIAIFDSAYNCTIENNTTQGCEVNGICVFNGAHDNIIRNNTFQSSRVGEGAAIEIGWGNPYDNLVYGNACAGNNIGLFVSGTGNHVYNNIVIDRNFIIGLVVSANADPATNLHYCKDNEVNNNTFIIGGKAGESIYVGHYMDADCDSIDISGNTVHHNIFVLLSPAKHIYYTPTSTVDGVAFNNNIYSDYFGFKVRLPDTTILSTFSAWQGQSQDINSFYTNPMIRKNNGVPYSLSSPAYINNIGAINYCRKRNIILSR